jgi:hypothetical protein
MVPLYIFLLIIISSDLTNYPISLFVSVDLENTRGEFTSEQGVVTDLTNATDIVVSIDSFNDNFQYDYELENLPLDYLKVNDKIVATTAVEACEPHTPWLNCLRAENVQLQTKRCVQTYPIELSYGFVPFDNSTTAAYQTQIKRFTPNIQLQCIFTIIF